jgi:hypothetical protein
VAEGDGDGLATVAFVTPIVRLAVPMFPAASVAIAVKVCVPSADPVVSTESVQLVVPVAG